ncbi:MAG TPA: hypothetical protein VHV75_12320 [Solirubrobacteraceae bacterium]|nr:hypothetical protein [Solirubrobacteraceae bacterium]
MEVTAVPGAFDARVVAGVVETAPEADESLVLCAAAVCATTSVNTPAAANAATTSD